MRRNPKCPVMTGIHVGMWVRHVDHTNGTSKMCHRPEIVGRVVEVSDFIRIRCPGGDCFSLGMGQCEILPSEEAALLELST